MRRKSRLNKAEAYAKMLWDRRRAYWWNNWRLRVVTWEEARYL